MRASIFLLLVTLGACAPGGTSDPCQTNNGGCDKHATCAVSAQNTATCSCNEGYTGSGTVCTSETGDNDAGPDGGQPGADGGVDAGQPLDSGVDDAGLDAGNPDAGTGDAGGSDGGTSDAGAVPCAPTNVMATAGIDNAHVTWTAPGCGAPLTGYTIMASTGSQVNVSSTRAAGYFSGLTGGMTYTFTVSATNAVGAGPFSAPSNAVTPYDCSAEGAEFSSNCASGEICDLSQLCVSPSYSSSNGVVTDGVTGLLWQRNAPAGTYSWDPSAQSTTSAQYYCAVTVNQSNLGGYSSGWRLPTLDELFTIVVLGSVPSIDQTEFPGTAPSDYWTSTPDGSSYIWGIWFGATGTYQTTGSQDPVLPSDVVYVRCVHGP